MGKLQRFSRMYNDIFCSCLCYLAWEIANEPQLAPKEWTSEIAKFIRQRSPYQLVTAGIEGKYGFEDFWNTHSSSSIDYTTCHLWVEK